MRATVVVCLLVASCAGVTLPPNFQKCNRNQPDLKECLLKAAQNGISQLTRADDEVNIPNVHPLNVSELFIGAGVDPVAVDKEFKGCKLDGFHNMNVDKFEFDFEGKTLTIAGTFPEQTLECPDEFTNGTELVTIVLKNVTFSGLFNYEETMKDGKTFINFVSSKINIDPELAVFHFDFFDEVINDNWKEFFNEEMKDDYVDVVNRTLVQLFNNFFSKVSLEEAFD
ncbi:protein takeout-like isoform X2 [Tenebrio molitor]|uniref:protein takeout-like isoform X2 n=1 Tax=Tenebrio molitor TaxID=7067 RepID=UPI00362490EA